MSRGDKSAVIAPAPITPQFQNTTPLTDGLLPPLTPEEEQKIDEIVTKTPAYQSIMEDCIELKQQTIEAAAQAIAYIELIKEGEITKDDPELWKATTEVIAAAAKTAKAGRATLTKINADLKEAELPLGDCAMKGDAPPQPASQNAPGSP